MFNAKLYSLFLILFTTATSFAGWQQTFLDDFTGTALNRTTWKTKDYWDNQTLGSNRERQCYMPDVFTVSNGSLNITASARNIPRASCRGANTDIKYASGMITTAGCNPYDTSPACATLKAFSQTYGYFEMRAKLPQGKGFWPAFWLLPKNGSWPPEIDVMESLGHEPNKVYTSFHFKTSSGVKDQVGGSFIGPDFSAGFHRFGVDWAPGLLIYYIDGVERYRVTSAAVPSQPMYLLANLAVGGYWPGDPDATTTFPSTMNIDYIRAFKRISNGEPDALPPAAPTNISVSIVQPTSLTTLVPQTSYLLKASATGSTGVSKVEFYINDKLHCTRTASPYDCNFVAPTTVGTYRLKAVATSASGLRSEKIQQFYVAYPTTLYIQQPISGAVLKPSFWTTIAARATNTGGISKVELFVNDKLVCTRTVAPYNCSYLTPSVRGSYTIKAVATDPVGFRKVVSSLFTVN